MLSAPEPSVAALSHLHSHADSANVLREARKAEVKLRAKQKTKYEILEKGHVRDVISGWGDVPDVRFRLWNQQTPGEGQTKAGGQEGEKILRKLAQRGVVKLFNAIRVSSTDYCAVLQLIKSYGN